MSNLEEILNKPFETGSHGPVPDGLAHIFNKDPLELTEQDLTQIVTVLRAQRLQFLSDESTAKNEGKRPSYVKGQKKAAAAAFDPSKLEF